MTLVPSKGVTLLLQLISVPIVYHVLGQAQFSAYASITSAIVILNFLNLGMGGAIVTPLAKATADRNTARESQLLISAFVPLFVITCFALCICIPLLAILPLRLLFGVIATTAPSEALRTSSLIACTGTLLAVPLSVVDSVRQAYQEMHISNVFGTASNALLCIALPLVAFTRPTLPWFVATMSLLPLTFRVLNATLLVARRPHLLQMRNSCFSWTLTRELAGDGFSYVGAAAIANVLIYEWPIYYFARTRPVAESATFVIDLRFIFLFLSFGVSLLQPLWPAIADANARADFIWILKAVRRARIAALSYGAFCLLLFGFFMNSLVHLWLHRNISVQSTSCWLAGFYLLLAMWEYVHWPICLGLGKMRIASHLVFGRAVVCGALVMWGTRYGQEGAMLALCGSVLLVSAWYYPQLLSRSLADM